MWSFHLLLVRDRVGDHIELRSILIVGNSREPFLIKSPHESIMLSLCVGHLLTAVVQLLSLHILVLDAREFVVNAIMLGNVHIAISVDFSLLIIILVRTDSSMLLVDLRCHLKVK